ncbi:MAG: hypothetical protein K6D94_13700 [Clostridiales bacterium]|nr:hypothetical protein [Clostridiales bacterium]
MKRAYRYAASTLAALLAVTSVMVSCGEKAAAVTAETKAETVITEAETEDSSYHADFLPDADYGGYKFRILGYSDSYPPDIEAETGAMIDDTIYRRNRIIEEKYNIEIVPKLYLFTDYPQITDAVTKAGRAQSDDFDLACMVFRGAYNAVLEGNVPPATALPVVDLDAGRPWYNNSMNESITIDGVGLICYTAFDNYPSGGCLIFNKKIVDDLGLGDPYAAVDGGNWTYEDFYSMSEAAISDLDGDGSFGVGDRFALISEWDRISALAYLGTGNLLVEIIDGIPTVSQTERLHQAFLKMQEHTVIPGYLLDTFKTFGTAESSRLEGYTLFKNEHSMFVCTSTNTLTSLGDMEDDFGIIPFPKWEESQDRYYCYSSSANVYVPLWCSSDLERVMVIKEALAVESLNLVYPTYYDNALKNRYIRDNESLRMLELIVNSTVNDLGTNPFWDIIRDPWQSTLSSGKDNFMSKVEKNMKKSQKALDDLMEMIATVKTGD